MITCPSCNHQNPEGSLQCENCYTPMPAVTSCPNCGTSVQTDATFCGQCGFNLQAENPVNEASAPKAVEETAVGSFPDLISLEELSPTPATLEETSISNAESDILPETSMSSPITSPWDDEEDEDLTMGQPKPTSNLEQTEMMNVAPSVPDLDVVEETVSSDSDTTNNMPWEAESPDLDSDSNGVQAEEEVDINNLGFAVESEDPVAASNPSPRPPEPEANIPTVSNVSNATQLQVETASLLHLQTNTTIEIPIDLSVVRMGKPNGQIPPDVDVAGFPDSEVVSRHHADIRIEGDAYYIEDVGSSNGTYVNHTPLVRGNRHRLRPGDRVALGKGDLVTFIFQLG